MAGDGSEIPMSWQKYAPAFLTAGIALAGLFGFTKYLIEPWFEARNRRRKYGTALWIACEDLRIHLDLIHEKVNANDRETINALKKIPRYDSRASIEWFTKVGYYTTVTAYKIAMVSAWLSIYKRELLFVYYSTTQKFLSNIYAGSDALNESFGDGTCLWYSYFNALGDKLIVREQCGSESSLLPMSFADFCDRYANDNRFLMFFDQLHMYIWFVANQEQPYLESVKKACKSLDELKELLKKEKLLRKDFVVKRSPIIPSETVRSLPST
jgi:hypothetical protein